MIRSVTLEQPGTPVIEHRPRHQHILAPAIIIVFVAHSLFYTRTGVRKAAYGQPAKQLMGQPYL